MKDSKLIAFGEHKKLKGLIRENIKYNMTNLEVMFSMLGFDLGSRTIYTANRLVNGIKELSRWGENNILKVATDKLAAYKRKKPIGYCKNKLNFSNVI